MYTKNRSVAAPSQTAAPSPFLATLTDTPQLAENTTTLSLVFATLTVRVKHKSCICHSCKKTPGGGGPILHVLYFLCLLYLDSPLQSRAPQLRQQCLRRHSQLLRRPRLVPLALAQSALQQHPLNMP